MPKEAGVQCVMRKTPTNGLQPTTIDNYGSISCDVVGSGPPGDLFGLQVGGIPDAHHTGANAHDKAENVL